MLTITDLRNEQASRILDALDRYITTSEAITIYREEAMGRVGVRFGLFDSCPLYGATVRDALAQMLQVRAK